MRLLRFEAFKRTRYEPTDQGETGADREANEYCDDKVSSAILVGVDLKTVAHGRYNANSTPEIPMTTDKGDSQITLALSIPLMIAQSRQHFQEVIESIPNGAIELRTAVQQRLARVWAKSRYGRV